MLTMLTGKKKKAEQKEKFRVPRTVQQTIPYLQALDNGLFEVKKGIYSKTIRFQDVNYQTSRQEDQEDMFVKYGAFLNYFSPSTQVQITIFNRSMNKASLESNVLIKSRSDGLDEYRDEYNSMLKGKITEGRNDIIKEKYLTFSFPAKGQSEAKGAVASLENEALNNFRSLGSQTQVLTTEERLELLHDFYRPGHEGEFNIDVSTLRKQGLTTKDVIAPDGFEFKRNYFRMGEKLGRAMFVSKLPSFLTDKFISELTDFPFNMVTTINIRSVAPDDALKRVKRQITGMEQDKIEQQKKASKAGYDPEMINHELRLSLREAEELLDDLQSKNQKMFLVNILIVHLADTIEELDRNTDSLNSVARKNLCQTAVLNYQQEDALASALPLGQQRLKITRTLTTESTAIFMPFTAQELIQKGGMYYGLNAVSRNLIIFRRINLKNANGFILGTPGSGKSFAAKREMVNVLLNTLDDVIIIDPEREYTPLAENFGGEIIQISSSSKNNINPMDLNANYSDDDDPLLLKSEFILSLCECIIGGSSGLSAKEKTIIDRCVKKTYAEYMQDFDNTKIPTLLDFQHKLESQPEDEARSIALELELYTRGSLSTFAKKTNININKRMVVFDIKDLGKQLKTMGMLIVLDAVWNRITQNRVLGKRTWLYIDEIYLLFANDYSANFLFELYKRARKWGGIPTGITQNVEDLLSSELARRMLSNSDFILMLNQAPMDRAELAKLLSLSDTQIGYITNADPGQGLLFAGNSIIPFRDDFPRDTKLYQMMTTKPDEIKKAAAATQ